MEHLHKYKIVGQNDEAVVEVCSECKKKLVTKKYEGKIDNKTYLQEHRRDVLQPTGVTSKLFQKYYGKAKV